MKFIKVAVAFLLFVIAGVFVIVAIGKLISVEKTIEPFFILWLMLIIWGTGFMIGYQFPHRPLISGGISGLILVFLFLFLLVMFLPMLCVPSFLLISSGITMLSSIIASFLGAAWQRARILLGEEEKSSSP